MAKNKIAKALRIPRLLKMNGRMTADQLARELKVDVRTLKNYILDLYEAGIEIESMSGRYGGYELKEKAKHTVASLTCKEFEACIQAESFLKQNNFVYSEQFIKAMEKLRELRKDAPMQIYMTYSVGKIKCNEKVVTKNQRFIDDIIEAIQNLQTITIDYYSLNSGMKERVVHPYAIFEYQGAMYLAGFCEINKELRYFKLSRMQSLVTNLETFTMPTDFNIEQHMAKSIGLFSGDTYDVELKIRYPMSYVIKEFIIVDDQEIKELGDKSILFHGKLSGFEDIKRWILSLGSDVEVIGPQELKIAIKKELETILKKMINL